MCACVCDVSFPHAVIVRTPFYSSRRTFSARDTIMSLPARKEGRYGKGGMGCGGEGGSRECTVVAKFKHGRPRLPSSRRHSSALTTARKRGHDNSLQNNPQSFCIFFFFSKHSIHARVFINKKNNFRLNVLSKQHQRIGCMLQSSLKRHCLHRKHQPCHNVVYFFL